MGGRTLCDWNQGVYDSPAIADVYADSFVRMGLLDAERRILDRLGNLLEGKAILDIGVGGGRTAAYLGEIAGRYVGIDYAKEMVSRCRERFPGLDFRRLDARDMSEFAKRSFDVVLFSFNGIDYTLPDGRVRILEEVWRVLKSGGTFFFSSHNVRARAWRPRLRPNLVFEPNPARLLRRNLSALRKHIRSHYYYRRNKKQEVHGDGFSIRVDQAHEYRLLTYHVSPGYQTDQLRAVGFDEVMIFGNDGEPIASGDGPTDPWLYYVARSRRPERE
jgi:SAM-dependent methyltransferase